MKQPEKTNGKKRKSAFDDDSDSESDSSSSGDTKENNKKNVEQPSKLALVPTHATDALDSSSSESTKPKDMQKPKEKLSPSGQVSMTKWMKKGPAPHDTGLVVNAPIRKPRQNGRISDDEASDRPRVKRQRTARALLESRLVNATEQTRAINAQIGALMQQMTALSAQALKLQEHLDADRDLLALLDSDERE